MRGMLRSVAAAVLVALPLAGMAGCSGTSSGGSPAPAGGPVGGGGAASGPGLPSGTPAASSAESSAGSGGSGLGQAIGQIAGSATGSASPSATAASGKSGGKVSVSRRSQAFFSAPSKNIGCYMDATGARCDIAQRTWRPPAKPSSCPVDFGQGISLSGGRAHFVCAGDTVLGATEVLAYRHAIRVGDFQCTSQPSGIRCDHLGTGHAFVLARTSFSLS